MASVMTKNTPLLFFEKRNYAVIFNRFTVFSCIHVCFLALPGIKAYKQTDTLVFLRQLLSRTPLQKLTNQLKPVALFVFILFSFNIPVSHAIPADQGFPPYIFVSGQHVFSDRLDPQAVVQWCTNYINTDPRWREFRGCTFNSSNPITIGCRAVPDNPGAVSEIDACVLTQRCRSPQTGEYTTQAPTFGSPYCEGSIEPEKVNGRCDGRTCKVGNPIHPATGNKYQVETDYVSPIPDGLEFKRYYNSADTQTHALIGRKWMATYFQYVNRMPDGDGRWVEVRRPDGKRLRYRTGGGAASNPIGSDITENLRVLRVSYPAGQITGWEFITDDLTVEEYNADGQLTRITSREGHATDIAYQIVGGKSVIDTVTGPFGRVMEFEFNSSTGRLESITDPGLNQYLYSYDANGNLTSVTYPSDTTDNYIRLYHYEEGASFPHHLTGMSDVESPGTPVRYSTYDYDTEGRAISSEHAGAVDSISLVYNADGTTTITDAKGLVQTYHFRALHGVPMVEQIDGDKCMNCSGQYASSTFDANGFVASRTDFNGVTTTYVHDSRGLELSRTEAVGTPQERTITTEWDLTFRLPVLITEPGRRTRFFYDTQGRLIERVEEVAP